MRNLSRKEVKQVLGGAVTLPHIRDLYSKQEVVGLDDDAPVSVRGWCWLCQREVKRYYLFAAAIKESRPFLVSCQAGGCKDPK